MDIDGPEFIADVNNQIAHYRAASVHNTALNDAYSQYINDIQMSQEIRKMDNKMSKMLLMTSSYNSFGKL